MTTTGAQTRTFTTEIEGKTLEIGLGRLAQNAAASCTIRYGDTVLLMTVCEGDPRPGLDFFPLTVDYGPRGPRERQVQGVPDVRGAQGVRP